MCSIEDNEIEKPTIKYDASNVGIRPLPYNSKKDLWVSPGITLNFI